MRNNPPKVDWTYDWPAFRIEKDDPLTKTVTASYETVLEESAKYQSWQPVSDAIWYQDVGVPSKS